VTGKSSRIQYMYIHLCVCVYATCYSPAIEAPALTRHKLQQQRAVLLVHRLHYLPEPGDDGAAGSVALVCGWVGGRMGVRMGGWMA